MNIKQLFGLEKESYVGINIEGKFDSDADSAKVSCEIDGRNIRPIDIMITLACGVCRVADNLATRADMPKQRFCREIIKLIEQRCEDEEN